jgi:hypothetical protein
MNEEKRAEDASRLDEASGPFPASLDRSNEERSSELNASFLSSLKSSDLDNAIVSLQKSLRYRNVSNKKRVDNLVRSRQHSETLDPYKIQNKQELSYNHDEKEADLMIEKFFKGEHFHDKSKIERDDLDLESRMYQDVANVFIGSDVMATDYRRHHIGDVHIPEDTAEQRKYNKEREEYTIHMSDKTKIFKSLTSWRNEVAVLRDIINDNEEEVVSIQKNVELYKNDHDFEWQVEKQRRAKELKAKALVDREKLEFLLDRYNSFLRIVREKYPESSSEIAVENTEINSRASIQITAEGDAPIIDLDAGKVYGWIIGRVSEDKNDEGEYKITNVVFGQFTREITPPTDGYIFVGKNFDRNMLDSALMAELSGTIKSKKNTYSPSGSRSGSRGGRRSEAGSPSGSPSGSPPGSRGGSRGGHRSEAGSPPGSRGGQRSSDSPSGSPPGSRGGSPPGSRGGQRLTQRASPPGSRGSTRSRAPGSSPGSRKGKRSTESTDVTYDTTGKSGNPLARDRYAVGDSVLEITKNDNVTVTPFVKNNLSISARLRAGDTSSNILAYRVKGCSLDVINGEYLDAGKSSKVTMYKNVRGWALFRCTLIEIPELGIFAESCYDAFKGPSLGDILDSKSKRAFHELVDIKNFKIVDGSVQFKRRFAEMSRAGNRIINMDQTFQTYYNEQLKADVREENDKALMFMLAALMESKKSSGLTEATAVSAPLEVVHEEKSSPPSPTSPETKTKDDDTHASESSSKQSKKKKGEEKSLLMSNTDLNIRVTLSHHINYQVASQGYMLSKDSSNDVFIRQESELATEVTKYVEMREASIYTLRLEAEKAQQKYLEYEGVLADLNTEELLRPVLQEFNNVREVTLQVSEALGAWGRLCAMKKVKVDPNKHDLFRVDSRLNKMFCVIISYKGSALYPQSRAVNSTVRAFKRGIQEEKKAINMKNVGLYKTREEAQLAFEKALASLMPHQVIPNDNKMIVGLRSCGKHYLAHTSNVPADLPCEVCKMDEFNKPNTLVPTIYDEPLNDFVYKGANYLEKMWNDLSFLTDNLLLTKALPEYDFQHNPLLLTVPHFKTLLDSLYISPLDPMATLKGKIEQLVDAKKAAIGSKRLKKSHALSSTMEANDSLNFELEFGRGTKLGDTMNTRLLTNTMSSMGATANTAGGAMGGTVYDRLRLGMSILGQSATLSKELLPSKSIPDQVNVSALVKHPLQRSATYSSLPSEYNNLTTDDVNAEASLDTRTLGTQDDSMIKKKKKSSNGPVKDDYKEAVYTFRGAKFASGQMRSLPVHRDDDIFCVGDRGEFFGLSRGRAAKAHDLAERTLQEGKERVEARKKCSDRLRVEYNRHFVESNLELIHRLIDRAKYLKGSVLELDITQAEIYMRNRKLAIKRIKRVQCLYRGYVARGRVFRIKESIKQAQIRARMLLELCVTTANLMVPEIIAKAVASRVKILVKPLFSMVVNLSGVYTFLSLYDRPRIAKKPLDLCASCQFKVVCRTKNHLNETYRTHQSVCTCVMIRGEERWRMRAIDPLTGAYIEKDFTITEVKGLIGEILKVRPMFDKNIRCSKLVGRTFGALQALFYPDYADFSCNDMSRSYNMARLRAAEESSLLPLLPKNLSQALIDIVASTPRSWSMSGATVPLPMDEFYSSPVLSDVLYQSTAGPATVSNVEELDRSYTLDVNNYQPYMDLRTAINQINQIKERIRILEGLITGSNSHYNHLIKHYDYDNIRIREIESKLMEFEDARTYLIRTTDSIDAAADKITRVMKYSKQGIEQYTLEESNVNEDWQQSYDVFEDGNGWKNLNNRRKMESLWKTSIERYHVYWDNISKGAERFKEGTALIRDAVETCRIYTQTLEEYTKKLPAVEPIQQNIRKLAKETVKVFVSTLSMPRKKRDLGRRIQRVPYDLCFIRDPLERCRKQYRGAWIFLERKIMALRPIQRLNNFVLRCTVEIFTDITTGYYIIHVGQDELPMEEATQHLDFDLTKQDFSDLTSHGLENDIILRPNDVKLLLSKSPSWPAVNAEVQPVNFKNKSLKYKFMQANEEYKEELKRQEDERKRELAVEITAPVESPKSPKRKTTKEGKTSPLRPGSMSQRRTTESPPVTPSSANSPLRKRKTELQSPPATPSSSRLTAIKRNNTPSTPSRKDTRSKPSEPSEVTITAVDPVVSLTESVAVDTETSVAVDTETSVAVAIDESSIASRTVTTLQVYIPPSKRLRDITYVRVWKKQEDKLAPHAASYSLRRKKKETDEVNIAKKLFTYLRLQPHTGKPCLGLTHFMRRIEYTTKHFTACQWYLDALHENPINGTNEVHTLLYTYQHTSIIARVRFCLNNLEVKLTMLNNHHHNEKHVSILISTLDVFDSMMRRAPVLLGSFLTEIILNRFSRDSIQFIVSNLDLQLPGDEKAVETVCVREYNNEYRRLGRAGFRHEYPRLFYLKQGVTVNSNGDRAVRNDDHLRYRGPVYAKHKFMAGIYFKISFYMGVDRDLLIKFSQPIDGNFSGHSYSKQVFYVTLTRAELIAYVTLAKVGQEDQIPSTLEILHSLNQENLYNLILDAIVLNLKLVMNGHPGVEVKEEEKAVEGVVTTENFYNPYYTRDKLMKLMLKFNLWSRRLLPCHKPRTASLSKTHYDTVDDSLLKLDRQSHWNLRSPTASSVEDKGKLVEVYTDIWVTNDLERYFGVGDMRTLKKKQAFQMQSTTGIRGVDLIQLSELPAFVPLETGGYLTVSYWKVRVFTNETKNQFYLDLAASNPSDKTVMRYLEEKESEFMQEEDSRSARYALQSRLQELRADYVRKLKKLQNYLNNDLKKKYLEGYRRAEAKKRGVEACKEAIFGWWDELLQLRSCANYVSTKVKVVVVENDENQVKIDIYNGHKVDVRTLNPIDAGTLRDGMKQVKAVLKSVNNSPRASSRDVRSMAAILNKLIRDLYSTYNQQDDVVVVYQSPLPTAPKRCGSVVTKLVEAVTTRNNTTSACLNRFTINIDEQKSLMRYAYRQASPWTRTPVHTQDNLTPFTKCFGTSNYIFSKPVNGPFDVLSLVVYRPDTARTWQVVTCLRTDFHFPWAQGVDEQIPMNLSESVVKITAKRVVENALLRGFVTGICHEMSAYVEEENNSISKKIEKILTEIEGVTASLGVLNSGEDPVKLKELLQLNNVKHEVSLGGPDVDPALQDEVTAKLAIDHYLVPPIEYKIHTSKCEEEDRHGERDQLLEDRRGDDVVHGLLIHFDQAKPCLPTVCRPQHWSRLASNLLNCEYPHLKRIHTAAGIVFSTPGTGELNPRAALWIDEFRFYVTGQERLQTVKLQREQAIYDYKTSLPTAFNGNILILFRYSALIPLSRVWMLTRYKEYEPIRLMRKAKEGREREYRVENHVKFRSNVLITASIFRCGFELLFSKKHLRDTVKGRLVAQNQGEIAQQITWKTIDALVRAQDKQGEGVREKQGEDVREKQGVNPFTDVSINPPFLDTFQRLMHYCRVLLSQFLLLRDATDKYTSKKSNEDEVLQELAPEVLDEYNLVDTALIHNNDVNLLRFDSLPNDAIFTNFIELIKFDYTPKNESSIAKKARVTSPDRHELQPRAGQVMYCVYQLHCYECVLPFNMCTFPGCSTIRSYALTKLITSTDMAAPHPMSRVSEGLSDHQLLATFNGDARCSQDHLVGTGNHPVELGIKRFLIYGKELWNYDLQRLYKDPVGVEPTAEIAREKQLDDDDAKRRFDEKELRIHWDKLLNEGREFRFIHRRLLNPAVQGALSFQQVIAINNIGNKDEKFVALESTYNPYAYLHAPVTLVDDVNADKYKDSDATAAPTSRLVSLPRNLAIEMLGGERGEDSRGFKLSPIEIDPYPQATHTSRVTVYINHKKNHKHMMSPLMFQWLTSHLSTSRPCRQTSPASGDRGQHLSERVALKFDRMHCESSIILDDGSLVIIQILHGILEGSRLYLDEQEVSGSADGAIRFLPVHIIDKLKSGLTLVAYDVKSDVACCLALQGKSLERVSMAFILKHDDYPGIAKKLIEQGQHVIRISRIGSVCTGVSVDINALIRVQSKSAQRRATTQHVQVGRKSTIKSSGASRLQYAAGLLASTPCK